MNNIVMKMLKSDNKPISYNQRNYLEYKEPFGFKPTQKIEIIVINANIKIYTMKKVQNKQEKERFNTFSNLGGTRFRNKEWTRMERKERGEAMVYLNTMGAGFEFRSGEYRRGVERRAMPRGCGDRSYDRGYDRSYDRGYDRSYDRGYDRSYDRGYDRSYDKSMRLEEFSFMSPNPCAFGVFESLGIDLGTTNSAIASIVAGQPTILPNPTGSRLTPSVIGVTKSQEFIVGDAAKRQAVVNPENTYFSLKSLIGRQYDSVETSLPKLPFRCSKAQDGFVKIECPILGRSFYPQQLSAQVVGSLAQNFEQTFDAVPKEVVVTVPAYFDDVQRNATKDAGVIAGLRVNRIINEPTAACLAYGFDKSQNALIYVFDAGGGTFDVSIVEAGEGVFEVIQTDGDPSLGGDDVDERITSWLTAGFSRKHEVDLQQQSKTIQRVKEAVEKAKCELSAASLAPINLPFIANNKGKPRHLFVKITRDTLNELLSDLVVRFRMPMLRVLEDSNLGPNDIDHVILVGGTTRVPLIRDLITDYFDVEPICTINPDEVVALGASIQANIISGDSSDIVLIDVTPLSLGIETLGGVNTKLIPRNTSLPASKKEIFSTATDNQPGVEINVLQGEREFAADCRPLGTFKLTGIQPAPRGVPQIAVNFQIDVDGILKVSALDQTSGATEDLEIRDSNKKTPEEIQQIIDDSTNFFEEDQKRKRLVDAKNGAEALIYEAQKKIQEGATSTTPESTEKLQAAIQELRSAVNREDEEVINRLTLELGQLLNTLPKDGSNGK